MSDFLLVLDLNLLLNLYGVCLGTGSSSTACYNTFSVTWNDMKFCIFTSLKISDERFGDFERFGDLTSFDKF